MTFKIALGADHAGFERKQELLKKLKSEGHQVTDMGCESPVSCDYPDFAKKVAEAVAKNKADRGILICGTGIGMAIAANKVPGVRAAVCWNEETAKVAAEHNHANVLCLGARTMTGPEMAKAASVWLSTTFGGDRHARRVAKIMDLEKMSSC